MTAPRTVAGGSQSGRGCIGSGMRPGRCCTSAGRATCVGGWSRTGRISATGRGWPRWCAGSRGSKASGATPSTRRPGSSAICWSTPSRAGTVPRAARRSPATSGSTPARSAPGFVSPTPLRRRRPHFGPYLGGLRIRLAISALHRVLPLPYTPATDGSTREFAQLFGIGPADRASPRADGDRSTGARPDAVTAPRRTRTPPRPRRHRTPLRVRRQTPGRDHRVRLDRRRTEGLPPRPAGRRRLRLVRRRPRPVPDARRPHLHLDPTPTAETTARARVPQPQTTGNPSPDATPNSPPTCCARPSTAGYWTSRATVSAAWRQSAVEASRWVTSSVGWRRLRR